MDTYDIGAFERFCAGLVNRDFSPIPGTGGREWSGPLRPSLRPLTPATRMKIYFYDGWPLQHARVVVEGLHSEHSAAGTICLWANDDPAQVAGRDLEALWDRLDEWAALAQKGFRVEDRALDSYLVFERRSTSYRAELPFADLVQHSNDGTLFGLIATMAGTSTLMIETQGRAEPPKQETSRLNGAFCLRRNIGTPPRNLGEVRDALTRRQKLHLDRGLARRSPTRLAEPSGGLDFVVLAWSRHDTYDAMVLAFENDDGTLRTSALPATSNDTGTRRRRAGPDADLLACKKVLVAGAGSVGGHVAVALASAGVGRISLHDNDHLTSGNLVRHVCPKYLVGFPKTAAVSFVIGDHAPWTRTELHDVLPHGQAELTEQIDGVDLVVDCTGLFSLSAALAEICRRTGVPLVTGALYHGGALARVQRQAEGDTPIAARPADPAYLDLPTEDPVAPSAGFLELGCTAPVHNASPVAVLHTAAEISRTAVDLLTGRRQLPDERIIVHQAMKPPFDRAGTYNGPRPEMDGTT